MSLFSKTPNDPTVAALAQAVSNLSKAVDGLTALVRAHGEIIEEQQTRLRKLERGTGGVEEPVRFRSRFD